MAILALQSAATGLAALDTSLDVIANNLANVNTPGFKAGRTNFQDLLYIERSQPGVENSNRDQRPTGLYVGLGVKVSGTQNSFVQGSPLATGLELDMMIQGNGFFAVSVEPDISGGTGIAYTRAGNFALNSDRQIVLANDQGRRLVPEITIPDNAERVEIAADGQVMVKLPDQTEPQPLTRITLSSFVNNAGLKQVGENLFVETNASGAPQLGDPATEGRGRIMQGFLESSNVDPTKELVELIRTQRAYEFNSQSIRAADEALRTVAQIRR